MAYHLGPGTSLPAEPSPHGQRTTHGARGPQTMAADRRTCRRRVHPRPGWGGLRRLPIRAGERRAHPSRRLDRRRRRVGDDTGRGDRRGAGSREGGSRSRDRRLREGGTLHDDSPTPRPACLGRPSRERSDGGVGRRGLGRTSLAEIPRRSARRRHRAVTRWRERRAAVRSPSGAEGCRGASQRIHRHRG